MALMAEEAAIEAAWRWFRHNRDADVCPSRRSWRGCMLDARVLIRRVYGTNLNGDLRRGDLPRLARLNPFASFFWR